MSKLFTKKWHDEVLSLMSRMGMEVSPPCQTKK